VDKAWQELLEVGEANRREWQRVIEDNLELQADLRALRARYGLSSSYSEAVRWAESASPKIEELSQELADLAAKHGIPPKWHCALFYLAVLGRPFGAFHGMGFPRGRLVYEDGHFRSEIVIDSETVVDNPIVQEHIRGLQRQFLEFLEGPPRPQPMNNNPRRLDWQPVWEWHRKHPDVTLKELAELLGYSYGYMRQQLTGFD